MNPILQTQRLNKVYPNGRGIREVNLELYRGDVYGLLGPNGSGKTTLLKLITGLIRPQRGSVTLFGADLDERYEAAMRRVGCMIESADFYDFISASQYLRLIAEFYPGIPGQRLDEVLDQVGLLTFRKEKIKGFSTGMKQKLALAAAILPEPELVILDEPTNGLDIEGTVMFRNLVKRLAAESNTTFLISSHMIHELEQLCNRFGIIYEGELKIEGAAADFLPDETLEGFYIGELQKAREEGQRAKL